MKTIDYQRIMSRAWQLFKVEKLQNADNALFANALRNAWAEQYRSPKLKELLPNKIVKFKFKKLDGTIRPAIGTLRADILQFNNVSTNSSRQPIEYLQTYYDVEKQAFRCFYKTNLISIDEIID